ncbi:repressor LexA [candidate division KSB1 bacterium]|nr:MAG: repressor LexA [candidate division KSB1 bacterium]
MEKLTEKQLQAFRYIRNSLVHDGRSPSVRELMDALEYNSPNSAALVIESLIKKRLLRRRKDKKLQMIREFDFNGVGERTREVPLVGTVPCGSPVLAEENIEAKIQVSEKLARPPHSYFILKARGDSMNAVGINDGDLVLVRQQPTASNGDYVVALVDGEATIKEFRQQKGIVLLKPRSTSKMHKPIVVTDDLHIQGVVVTAIPGL